MSFRPTPKAWGMLGGASVLFAAATIVGVGGLKGYLRASATEEAYHIYFRTPEPGTGGLETVNTALDRAPDDASLVLLKACMLAGREKEQQRALEMLAETAKGGRARDETTRLAAGFARIGAAMIELTRARKDGSESARRAAWDRAAEAAEAAAKILPDRLEPHALLAAALVERGEPDKAEKAFAAADAASEPPTRPGLLMLYTARAEAARMAGDHAGETTWLMRAIHLAPPNPKGGGTFDPATTSPGDVRTRLTRAVARRTADPRLSGEPLNAAIAYAQLLLLPVHPLERYRRSALYGLERERLALVKEAIGTAEARKGSLQPGGTLEGAKRTLEEALKETPGDPGLTRQLAAVHALACRAETNPAARKGLARRASDTIAEAAERMKAGGSEGYELYLAAAVFARDAELYEQSVRLLERAAKCGEGGASDARLDRCVGVVNDQWGGRVPKAIEGYRKALQKAPGAPDASAIEARLAVLEARQGGTK